MLIVVCSAFLPWMRSFGVSVTGIDTDGVVTLSLAAVGLALVFTTSVAVGLEVRGTWNVVVSRGVLIMHIVLALIVVLVAVTNMNSAAGIGLYGTYFAGLAWLADAIWHLVGPGFGDDDADSDRRPLSVLIGR